MNADQQSSACEITASCRLTRTYYSTRMQCNSIMLSYSLGLCLRSEVSEMVGGIIGTASLQNCASSVFSVVVAADIRGAARVVVELYRELMQLRATFPVLHLERNAGR